MQNSIQIKDIKPLVEISDFSFWWFLILATLAVAVVGYLLYFGAKWLKRKSDENRAKRYLEALHNIDWSNPKKASYKITEYGRFLARDDKTKEVFSHLLPHLEQYKYRKKVKNVDRETLREFELFKQVCDESV